MKKLVSLFLALVLLFSAALAEDGADEAVEEIVEDVMLDDEEDADEAGADGGAAIPDQSVFTPSYGSPWKEDLGSSYWTTPMDIHAHGTDHSRGYRKEKGPELLPTDQTKYLYVPGAG